MSEELIAFITPSSSSTQSVVTVGIFHMGEGARLAEVSVMEQILQKFPEILGELSIRKQCVRGSFFFSLRPTHECLGTRLSVDKPQMDNNTGF